MASDTRKAQVKAVKTVVTNPSQFGGSSSGKGGPRTATQDNRGFNTGKASEPNSGK